MFPSFSNISHRRVVVTGFGVVDPFGDNLEHSWQSMLSGHSAITSISDRWPQFPSRVAGMVPTEGAMAFDPLKYVDHKDMKRMDSFIIYSMAATEKALKGSGLLDDSTLDKGRVGVGIGSGIGGLSNIADNVIKMNAGGRVSPLFIPSSLINLASGNVAIKYGFSGPSFSNCAACASGLQAISDAARAVALGDADAMVAGGCEAGVSAIGIAGFAACRALSTSFNDEPHKASRPWDKRRDGFVISEGSGIIILEEYERAKRRGAPIYAEIIGCGARADVYHITSPDPSGIGARMTMLDAIKGAGIGVDDVDYVNAHATSTVVGDEVEILAASDVFRNRSRPLSMSSIKSSIGHLLGASGSVELVYCILAMRDNVIPPTINLDDPIESYGIDLVPNVCKEQPVNVVMSNAFGFGGINVSVIMRSV